VEILTDGGGGGVSCFVEGNMVAESNHVRQSQIKTLKIFKKKK
jgi:hypothetical protein